jgi:hypothetical protein
MRTHQYLWLSLGAVFLMSASFVASAAERTGIGKKGEIELLRPTHLGATMLPQGHYQVHHQMVEGQHYLIARHQELGRDGVLRDTGQDVARVRCRIVTFDAPPQVTELYWTKEPDGTGTATQIRIRGEGVGHVVVLEPARAK